MLHLRKLVLKLTSGSQKLLSIALEPSVRKALPVGDSASACEFMVFFADPPVQVYQIEQWLRPLEALAANGHAVKLVLMNSLSARSIADRTSLPILLTRSMEDIEKSILEGSVRGVFYVNNSQANFTMLRVPGPAHIHLSHGESDKSSMVSNQLKAYDYVFIAGPAAEERILRSIPRMDPSHLVQIGRPQIDATPSIEKTVDRISVLYAPTWEGDSQAMAYSSLSCLGLELVENLLADPGIRLSFRPHPKTGTLSPRSASALKDVESAILKSAKTNSSAGHRIDRTRDSMAAIHEADLIISDVSAMAMDAIGLDKPLLLASSTGLAALTNASEASWRMVDVVPILASADVASIARRIPSLVEEGMTPLRLKFKEHVFGAEHLGTGTLRFIEAAVKATTTETLRRE